jgi:hypothetical protein
VSTGLPAKEITFMDNPDPPPAPGIAFMRLYLTPCEFSAELARLGLPIGEKAVRERCALPPENPLHIKSNEFFWGRYYIPKSEISRICGK